MATRFRNLYRHLVPGWLLGEGPERTDNDQREGEKVLYSLSLLLDAMTERLRLGLLARFPSYAEDDALNLIGRDRGIPRGRNERKEHYAARLRGWRGPRGHQTRGSAFALLNQVAHYFGQARCYTIDVKGKRNDRAADGAESYSYGNPWNWDGVWSYGQPWARFWIVIDLTQTTPNADAAKHEAHPGIGSGACWGGKIKNPDTTIGIAGFKPGDGRGVRRLVTPPRAWKPAGTRAEYVVYSLTGADPEPDGSWNTYPGRLAASQAGFRFGRLRLSEVWS
jgi:hypothetical protein